MTDINTKYLYHFRKEQKKHARLFVRMAMMCWLYMLCLFVYETVFNGQVPVDFEQVFYIVMSIVSLVLLLIAWRFFRLKGVYEVSITQESFSISYPNSERWSFTIHIKDIDRLEHQKPYTHAGKGIPTVGVITKDNQFYEICLNYFNGEFKAGLNPIKDMHNALLKVNSNITYSVNNTYKVW